MKKRILVVAHRWPPRFGGLQNLAYKYAELLSKTNHVSIITSKEKGIKNIKPKGTKLIEVNSNPFLYNHFRLPHPLFNLKELFLKMQEGVKESDVVLINDRYYLTSLVATYFAKKYNKRIVTILATSIQNYNGLFQYIYNLNNFIGKYVIKNSDYIVGVSKESLDNVLSNYHLEDKPKEVILNSLEYLSKVNSKEKRKLNLLFVGRLVDFKGVDLILELAKRLEKEKGIKFNIIGEGPDKENLLQKKDNLKLNNIIFRGFVPTREEVLDYYKKSDVVILLSKKKEGFPLSISDALVFGKPIIINKNVWLDEFEGFDLGFIENENNLSNIVKHIKNLAHNNKLYNTKSKEVMRFSKQFLDVNKNIKKLKRILKC